MIHVWLWVDPGWETTHDLTWITEGRRRVYEVYAAETVATMPAR